MGLIKNLPYTDFENSSALFGRAIGHPARMKLIQALRGKFLTRKDMAQLTGLSQNAIRDHLIILESAGLLEIVYTNHFLSYSLKASCYESSIQTLLLNEQDEIIVETNGSREVKRRLFPFLFAVRSSDQSMFCLLLFVITELLLKDHSSSVFLLLSGP